MDLPTFNPWFKPKLFLYFLSLAGLAAIATIPQFTQQWRMASTYRYPFSAQVQRNPQQSLQQEVSFYQQRIRQTPEDGLGRAALAGSYLKLARATGDTSWYLLAQQTAQASLVRLPFNNVGAQLILARVAEAKHDFRESIRLSQQVLRTQSKNEEALTILVSSSLAQGNIQVADRIAQQLVQQTPTSGTYLLQALVSSAKGADTQAALQFQQALAAEEPGETGSSARLRVLFGQFWMERGKPDRARALFQEALRILPQYPPALVNRAKLETRVGNYPKAEQLYTQVYSGKRLASVYDHVALAGIAETQALQGKQAEAAKSWNRAETFLREHDELNTFGHRREMAYILLARGDRQDVPEAVKLMEVDAALRRDYRTLETLAWAYAQMNRWQDAQKTVQAALKTGVRDAALYYRAGAIAAALDQSSLAADYRQQAKRIDPTLTPPMQQLLGLS
jgi:tetratricopeptide (TPR) repeat protein